MLTAPLPIQDPARRHGVALAVALILLVCAALRLWQLSTPPDMMFDEIYYAKDAKAIVDNRVGTHGQYRWAAGDEVSWPHPEMGKIAIALGILLFGDRSFGWRIPSVVAGIALLACIYPLARRLGLSPAWSLIALLFAAADPLGITQSRIATLDIFIAVWTVVSILFALRYVQDGWRPRWLFLSGIAGGMALATKWSGALALLAVVLIVVVSWLLQRLAVRRQAAAAAAEERDPARPAEAVAPRRDGSTWLLIGLVLLGLVVVWELFKVFIRGAALADVWPGTLALVAGVFIVVALGQLFTSATRVAAPPLVPPLAEQVPAEAPTGSAGLRILQIVLAFAVIPVGIYFLSYAQYFIAGHTWSDFVELHRQMWYFNLHLHATHTYASRAYTWIIDYRPVWYYFQGQKTYYGVIAIGNPFLWWLATLSLVAAIVLALLRRSFALVPVAAVILVLYLPWFGASRTSFLYYMTPVAPFMAILAAAALCLFARGVVPQRGWLAAAAAAVATAGLWWPVGSAAAWLFRTLPRHGGDTLGYLGVTIGCLLAAALVVFLLSPRMEKYRPWTTMVLAGMVIGIVVAFVPILLAIGISPNHWQHIMWFPKWI